MFFPQVLKFVYLLFVIIIFKICCIPPNVEYIIRLRLNPLFLGRIFRGTRGIFYLITSATKYRTYAIRQETIIAARHTGICVFMAV